MDPNQHHDLSEHDDDYFLEPHLPAANYSQQFYNDRPNSFVYAPHVQTATSINEPYLSVPPMPLGRPLFPIPSRGVIGLPRSHQSPEIVTSNMSTGASFFNVPIQDSGFPHYDPRNILSQNEFTPSRIVSAPESPPAFTSYADVHSLSPNTGQQNFSNPYLFHYGAGGSYLAQPHPQVSPAINEPDWDIAKIRGLIVPQQRYVSRCRNEEGALDPVIFFRTNGKDGIYVPDAVDKKYSGLEGRDDPMFLNRATSVSLRFEWPGYPSWSHTIKTKVWRPPRNQITLAKLATEIGKSLQKFIQEMEEGGTECTESLWRLDHNHLTMDSLLLVSLSQVSQGSWQPCFKVRE